MPEQITIHTFVLMEYVASIVVFLAVYWGIKRLIRMANAS